MSVSQKKNACVMEALTAAIKFNIAPSEYSSPKKYSSLETSFVMLPYKQMEFNTIQF